MNDSALVRATSSKVRENPFVTDSERRDGQDVVGRTFIPGMAPAGGQAAVGGGRWDLRQGPLPPASDDAGDDGRQPAAEGCGLAHGAWAAAVVATWRPTGGGIRVVLVDEPSGWVAFVCTNVSANVAEILLTVADRFSLETTYRRLQADRRSRPAAGVVRVGKYRCIQRVACGPSR